MKENVLFRTALFGGYNKDDVNEYVRRLETEIVQLQNAVQTAPAAPAPAASGLHTAQDSDFIVFDSASSAPSNMQMSAPRRDAGAIDASAGAEAADAADARLVETLRSELGDYVKKLNAKEKEITELNQALSAAEAENKQLEEKLKAAAEAPADADYQAIKDVLENTRIEAAVIIQKANNKADEIIRDARRQLEGEKRSTYLLMKNSIDENTRGLRTSKMYLENQILTIREAENKLNEVRSDIERLMNEQQEAEEQGFGAQSDAGAFTDQ